MVHTIVPILDESGTVVDRLFIYSDKPTVDNERAA
jgi:hypothetical protein